MKASRFERLSQHLARKSCLSKWLLQRDGAVTIFSAMVLSSLLLFMSILIDYARIAALHKITEDAARAGARSVLSAFDSQLYEQYGLFGRGGTSGDTIYSEVVKTNVERSASSAAFYRPIDAKIVHSHTDQAAVLGSHTVFERQVLEEMKYKAPIDFTLELASKFAPMAGAMKESAVTVDLLEQLRKLYDKRQASLARILALQKQAAEELGTSGLKALLPYGGLDSSSTEEGTASSLAGRYEEYAGWVIVDEQLIAAGKAPKYTQERAEYKSEAIALINELKKRTAKVMNEHIKLQSTAKEQLEQARLLNGEMRLIESKERQSPAYSGYDRVSGKPVVGSDAYTLPSVAASELQDIQKTADQLILPDAWFTEYSAELDDQAQLYTAFHNEASGFTSAFTLLLDSVDRYTTMLRTGTTKMIALYGQYEGLYVHPGSIVAKRQQELANGGLEKQRKEQEKQLGSLWKQAGNMLGGFQSVAGSEEQQALFNQLEERYKGNLQFNTVAAQGSNAETKAFSEDAHSQAEASAELSNGLFGGVADMLEQARDTVYLGEYVLQRYSVFAPQQLKMMLENGDTAELSRALTFHNQEAEYVIYGFHNRIGNVAAAYGELFSVRMAIRTMEGLSTCRSAGHPLLILSCSLIYGLEKTMEDMLAFADRGSAPLSKYANVEISYTDYLRLFMLLHGGANKEASVSRMIAVIEQNSGVTLSGVSTAVTGEVRTSAQLWFLPGVMQLLGSYGLLQGRVTNGRYETTQTIGWSY
ncbi:TadE/TadG family type IV pilus assembly protein [Paenibacillus sp. Leaf72]|uniref:TadE/TadG family type IV pilus assembly protein n=1 Tax=Paenibacillus sp. Leaf72 TaxID=1736234 RepID=UPI0007022E3F|nr:TadE family protein [Paenibacillus sp. Leaf72]KQN99060.1 hypothetical protein ASF12_20025 [Paenibacillus sp. Leaf72]